MKAAKRREGEARRGDFFSNMRPSYHYYQCPPATPICRALLKLVQKNDFGTSKCFCPCIVDADSLVQQTVHAKQLQLYQVSLYLNVFLNFSRILCAFLHISYLLATPRRGDTNPISFLKLPTSRPIS
jgi:hypothetical protein